MKIVSWNVNGINACKRKGFLKILSNLKADVVCCQEIKTRCPLNTPGYIQFWNPGQRSGYSGTLLLSKKTPLSVQYGFCKEKFDVEGRVIAAEYEQFYVVNLYAPNSQHSPERLNFRIEWDECLLEYLRTLTKPIILCGDFNVARDYIDVYPENLRNEENPYGFVSEEREGLNQLLNCGFEDVFRTLNPTKEGAYTWWSNRLNKRCENRGWRLDYFLVSSLLMEQVHSVEHLTEILGSDHCPIVLRLKAQQSQPKMTNEDLADMWRAIDWPRMEELLLLQQQKLSRAAYSKQWEQVTELQKKIVRSFPAKVLAVRHVTQVDSEPGIDGIKWRTDEEKMQAALSLTSKNYHARPYRHFLLQDGGKMRSINIPVAYDKAMQILYSYSLDPVAESTADRKSFAFRKGRSLLDAHAYICKAFDKDNAPEWIVRADVKACYDSLSHNWLIKNIPMDKKVLREILKPGIMVGEEIFPLSRGISQGGTISPILGNMALDGLQEYIYDYLPLHDESDYADGNLIRFADDIIVTVRTHSRAERVIQILKDFLFIRGLRLNMDKTYISRTTLGFEFLSHWYQRKDEILTVTPSIRAVKGFEDDLEQFILGFHGSQKTLIERLNRKLSGWANYHRITDAYDSFRHIDSIVQGLLAKKMRLLHPKRQWKHIVKKYWLCENGRHFFVAQKKPSLRVFRLANVKLTEHTPIRTSFNPYLDIEYYEWLQHHRDEQKVSGPKRRGIWERQEGRCYYCGKKMLPDEEIELIEIKLGKGQGTQNLAYIHHRCSYDILTEATDGKGVDLFELLEGVTEPEPLENPYKTLQDFFHNTNKSPITLTFQQIEDIIGDTLDWEANFYEAYWFDESPGMMGELWEDEFPFETILPEGREVALAPAWRSQGYCIQRLRLKEKRVIFRKEIPNVSALQIPTCLLETKIPDKAKYEIEDYLKYVVKKYGLR